MEDQNFFVDKSLYSPAPPPAIVLRSVNSTTLTSDWKWTNLQRPFFRLYFNEQKGAVISYKKERWPIQPGEAMVIPAWFPFASQCRGQVRHLAAHFDLDHGLTMTPASLRPFSHPLDKTMAEQLQRLSEKLKHRKANGSDYLILNSCIAQTLAHAYIQDQVWQSMLDGASLPSSSLVQASLSFAMTVEGHYLSVDEMAAHVGVSTGHLRRHLQQHLGISPLELLNRHRLRQACLHLRSGLKTLAEISKACGFDDRHYFSRWFRKHMAVTPSSYRDGMHSERHYAFSQKND